jgi:hypothetical protein
MACRVQNKGKGYLVFDGQKLGPYEQVGLLVLAPGGGKFVCAALVDDGWMLVRNGKKGAKCDSLSCAAFSPDGRRVACAASIDGKSVFLVDDEKCQGAPGVEWIGFAPDGRHMVWMTGKGAQSVIVCDGEEASAHGRIVIPESAVSKEKFRYVAVDKDRATLVEFEWPKETRDRFGLVPVQEKE